MTFTGTRHAKLAAEDRRRAVDLEEGADAAVEDHRGPLGPDPGLPLRRLPGDLDFVDETCALIGLLLFR